MNPIPPKPVRGLKYEVYWTRKKTRCFIVPVDQELNDGTLEVWCGRTGWVHVDEKSIHLYEVSKNRAHYQGWKNVFLAIPILFQQVWRLVTGRGPKELAGAYLERQANETLHEPDASDLNALFDKAIASTGASSQEDAQILRDLKRNFLDDSRSKEQP